MNNTKGEVNDKPLLFPRVFHMVDELLDKHKVVDVEERLVDVYRAQIEALMIPFTRDVSVAV